MAPDWNAVTASELAIGRDVHVAGPGLGVGGEPLFLEPVAQGDVLGVAELRRREGLALQRLGATVSSGLTTSEAPPEAAPEITVMASPLDCVQALTVGFGPM